MNVKKTYAIAWRIVAAIPPHSPAIAIHLPSAEDRPLLIESNSSHPTIAAGMPVNGPQQSSATIASINAATAFCPVSPEDFDTALNPAPTGCCHR